MHRERCLEVALVAFQIFDLVVDGFDVILQVIGIFCCKFAVGTLEHLVVTAGILFIAVNILERMFQTLQGRVALLAAKILAADMLLGVFDTFCPKFDPRIL